MVILRTDAGEIIGNFKNTRLAKAHIEVMSAEATAKVLVIQSTDGIVLSRRFPN